MFESDVLICGQCQKIFHHLPLFELHKRTCGAEQQRNEVPIGPDKDCIYKLAREIWKEFLLREMEKDPKYQGFCKSKQLILFLLVFK